MNIITVIILLAILFLVSVLSFQWVIYLTIIIMCVNINMLGFHLVLGLPGILLFSHFINKNGIIWKNYNNPIKKPMIIFAILAAPSFINTSSILYSLYLTLNLLSVITLVYVLIKTISGRRQIVKITKCFILMCVLNSFYIIVEAKPEKDRVFARDRRDPFALEGNGIAGSGSERKGTDWTIGWTGAGAA